MVINTNTPATNAARQLVASFQAQGKSLARLSSGSRIVSPEDDSAGLAQSIKFDADVHRNAAAMNNISNALSYCQTQDGELQRWQKHLTRASEVSVLAMDATKSASDIANYEAEVGYFLAECLESLSKTFNAVSLFQPDINGNTANMDVTIDSDGNKFRMAGVDLVTALANHIAPLSMMGRYDAVTEYKECLENVAALRAQVGANIARLKNPRIWPGSTF